MMMQETHAELLALLWGRHKPLQVVSWLSSSQGPLTPEVQRLVLDLLASDPVLVAAPCEHTYVLRLLKHLIAAAEAGHQQLCEEVVEAYTDMLSAAVPLPQTCDVPGALAPSWCLKTFCYAQLPPGQTVVQRLGQQRVKAHAAQVASCLNHAAHAAPQLDVAGTAEEQLPLAALDAASSSPTPAAPPVVTPEASSTASPTPPAGRTTHNQPSSSRVELLPGQPDATTSAPGIEQQPPTAGLISLRVSSNVLEGGTGCAEWEAGMVLAEVLLRHPHLVAGLRCVELGCGAGTVGIAAARAGAASVLLTDGDATTASNCIFNCGLNGVQVERWHMRGGQQHNTTAQRPQGQPLVLCGVLDWCVSRGGQLPAELQGVDVVMGSDLIYDPVAIPDLVRLLALLLGSKQHKEAIAYIATTKRNLATLDLFLETVRQPSSGLTLEDATHLLGDLADSQMLQFRHVPWLEEARPRVLLHAITPV